ncbi:histidine phosphatase superfamily (branch 2) domain-containing protein [Phthorimaea operculella]|nr:histidine phosphatase superfamily (branch 2) domain-containing protein [Phthorimaea operculella]
MAFKLILLLAAVASLGVSGAPTADAEQGTELVFAFMVHRHGDRTPDTTNVLASLNLDTDEVHEQINKWGYGQLTDKGKRTAYRLGEFIRRRYDELIAPKYNDSEIYIRAGDITRTKMTALTALSAIFPPVGENWSEDINWTPVPYTTLPAQSDYLLEPSSSCLRLAIKMFASEEPPVLPGFEDVLFKLAGILGNTNVLTPEQVFMAWSDLAALSAWASIWEKISQSCVLLNEFFEYAEKIINGEQTQTVRLYSAHDTNVYPFQEATKVTPQCRPLYASLYSLELRRVVATGEYVVLPVYLSDPNERTETLLQVDGCDLLCNYDQFKSITSVYSISEDNLKQKC